MHTDYCGVIFKCNECPIRYTKYESLITHARRKEHNINEKVSFKLPKVNKKPILNISKSESNLTSKINRMNAILPKSSSNMQLVIISQTSNKNDQSIQTDQFTPKLKSKFTEINRNISVLKKNTQQTQTGFLKEQLTAETQTIGDYLKQKTDENTQKKHFKIQSSTQTQNVSLKSVSSNTNISKNGSEFINGTSVKRSSSSTQTIVPSTTDVLYSSTHDTMDTDNSDLISNNLDNFDSNFFNCNMETQTDVMFDDPFNYCDYYINMYTQTCEDLFLNTLELNNIETQTVDDMLRSVESQTMMSQNKKPQIDCRDMSHMETQTDMEFKQMLEAINA
ncbi:hypothetical protein HHI36_019867 [Cryptolaemus montrouzieri]|uniref:C2H2-type domain-containing protein n=1 Tax=Cryptolaemus montrouzieri TaxID=559131 RepID=A0ABD2NA40_9CUCU